MIVAIASGKGGTGKTLTAASLVRTWAGPVVAVDLDVEVPNLHLFLNPRITGRQPAFLQVPVVDNAKCDRCGRCADFCQFRALSVLGATVMVFDQMCHGCGGCKDLCPQGAITWGSRELGEIAWGGIGDDHFLMGRLRVGEAMSPPLMRAVKTRLKEWTPAAHSDVIIDAPPGVSCPAINAVMDSDVIVLVTDPTPFGLFDLTLAYKAFVPLNKPLAVVINRDGIGGEAVDTFCRAHRLPVLARIPYDLQIAAAYAGGRIIAEQANVYWTLFSNLGDQLRMLGPEGRQVGYA